jgi:hypothetical protein
MGRLRAIYVLSAVLSGLLMTVAALYTLANPRAQLEARSAIHAAALDAFRLPNANDRDPSRTCLCVEKYRWDRYQLTSSGD